MFRTKNFQIAFTDGGMLRAIRFVQIKKCYIRPKNNFYCLPQKVRQQS